jgi:hypothetical protein
VGDLRDLKKENREKACFAVMWMQRSWVSCCGMVADGSGIVSIFYSIQFIFTAFKPIP